MIISKEGDMFVALENVIEFLYAKGMSNVNI